MELMQNWAVLWCSYALIITTNLPTLILGFGANVPECEISSHWNTFAHPDCHQVTRWIAIEALSCANQNFTCVPYWPREIGEKIFLNGNSIRQITNGTFRRQFRDKFDLERVTVLDLGNNQLSKIEPTAFSGLVLLHGLRLNDNQLSQIPTVSLSLLKMLRTLDLSKNPISSITYSDFEPLGKLIRLSLVQCHLSNLPPFVFRHLGDLQELLLDGNSLTHVTTEVFAGMINLNLVSLQLNNLVTIDFGQDWPIKALPNLKEVVVLGNPFVHVHNSSSKPKWYRRYLYYRRRTPSNQAEKMACEQENDWTPYESHHYNYISNSLELEGRGYVCVKRLRSDNFDTKIDYAKNKIEILDDGIFQRQFRNDEMLKKFRLLDLSLNLIKYIHPNAFAGLDSLETLKLDGNQLCTVPTASLALSGLKTLEKVMVNNISLASCDDIEDEFEPVVTEKDFISINTLELQQCQLTGKNLWKVLRWIGELETLNLAWNRIDNIPENWGSKSIPGTRSFPSVFNKIRLKQLVLDGNPLTHGQFGLSRTTPFTTVEILGLRSTGMKSLQPAAFAGFPNLKTLDLSSNEVAVIPDNVFVGNKVLTWVNLEKNKILTIGRPTMMKPAFGAARLIEITLGGNLINVTDKEVQSFNGTRCNCNVGGDYCVGNWMGQVKQDGLNYTCQVTHKVYRALETFKSESFLTGVKISALVAIIAGYLVTILTSIFL